MRASGTRRGKHRGWPGVGGRAQPHLRAHLRCDLGQAVTFEACFSHLSHAGRAGQSLGPTHPRAPTTQAREKPFLPSPSHGAPLTSAPVQVKSSGLKASSPHANVWKRKLIKGWEQLLATPLKAASAKQRLLMVRPDSLPSLLRGQIVRRVRAHGGRAVIQPSGPRRLYRAGTSASPHVPTRPACPRSA